jgi:hypothetical protein
MSGDIQITATFDNDTKRMHRFLIDEGQEITGSVYILKGKEIPDKVSIQLRTKAGPVSSHPKGEV